MEHDRTPPVKVRIDKVPELGELQGLHFSTFKGLRCPVALARQAVQELRPAIHGIQLPILWHSNRALSQASL